MLNSLHGSQQVDLPSIWQRDIDLGMELRTTASLQPIIQNFLPANDPGFQEVLVAERMTQIDADTFYEHSTVVHIKAAITRRLRWRPNWLAPQKLIRCRH